MLHKTAARDYDLREKVAEQVNLRLVQSANVAVPGSKSLCLLVSELTATGKISFTLRRGLVHLQLSLITKANLNRYAVIIEGILDFIVNLTLQSGSA